MMAKLLDILLAEIFHAFAAAVFKEVVKAAHKHGKRILNSLMGISDNEADEGIQVEELPDPVILMPKPKPEDKPFLDPIVEEILCKLKDEDVKIIGLWGKPKMGKTTIMRSLNNNKDIAKMFDIVIWVTVSEDLSFEKLQYKIARRLRLHKERITDPDEIYHQICKELESKTCLFLLDEASGSFHSSLITQYGNAKDSKVVFTARTRPDCWEMKADFLISVKPMSKTVSWEIFKEKVGENVNLPLVKPIAELVAEECAGFPYLIDKVASKFRRRDSYDMWKKGYEILQSWTGANIDDIDQLL